MKTVWLVLLAAVSVLLIGAASGVRAADEQRQDVIYYCNCGPECKCNSVDVKPGDCKCGKPMKWGHVLKVDGDVASVCTCKEGCKCKLDPNDASKCGCGNPVKKVSLKGTGMYFCNCGGSCMCNTISDKPGKCKCGMDLKKM
ncbi:MAG: hypothetical protein EPN25_03685 [Nitrospirae bacterium]|nr:MAG: hypothetical protein EPN25_03685 [Nitrospirota bacterium]